MNTYFVKNNSTGEIREINFLVSKNEVGDISYLIAALPKDDGDIIAIRIKIDDPEIITRRFEMNNILRQSLPKFNCSLVEEKVKNDIIQ